VAATPHPQEPYYVLIDIVNVPLQDSWFCRYLHHGSLPTPISCTAIGYFGQFPCSKLASKNNMRCLFSLANFNLRSSINCI